MGIVNVTPDSFSDGGACLELSEAVAHARALIDQGADLLDIGGESTRPGAQPVSAQEQMRRVLPLIEALADCAVPISVDTSEPAVMRAALAAGASVINDVCALRAPGAMQVVSASDCGVVLMHMQGAPRTMQAAPQYEDVVGEVGHFLRQRVQSLTDAGVDPARIVVDPGFGFGKSMQHNLALLAQLPGLGVDAPLLVGLSRKSMLGQITGRAVDERVYASITAAVLAVQRGAAIVRVHDVAATVDALRVVQALKDAPLMVWKEV
ncbi:MAG TPA: dihydropteroate synthase [Burkholderiaceae bacterium]|nr:dihydropteroate synthase [Burkholderiaceae bacterium]